jgi:hypothetical protein
MTMPPYVFILAHTSYLLTVRQWTYWVIQQAENAPPIAHPIHLHGHDMFLLGTGDGQFDADANLADLDFTNPPRRDVAFLKASGWLVIAYPVSSLSSSQHSVTLWLTRLVDRQPRGLAHALPHRFPCLHGLERAVP